MGVNIHPDRPFKPGGTNTHTSRKRQAAATNRAAAKARKRLRIAKAAHKEMREKGVSKAGALAILRHRYADPEDDFNEELPSRATFYRILARADEEGELSVEGFRDAPRAGRPPTQMDPDIQVRILTLVKQGIYSKWERLHKRICHEFGDRAPSKHVFNRFIEAIDPAEISASNHGSRAAVADALPKLTIPTTRPMEYWALDELSVPVFIKAHDPRKNRLVSVKPNAAAMLDLFSRVAVGFELFRPFANGTPGGYASHQITGLFFSSVLPEISPDPLKEFSGGLPDELRMDNHATHEELREMLRENGLTAASLRSQSPWANGLVEAWVDTFKGLCEDIRGASHRYLPSDRAGRNPKSVRTNAASSSYSREPRRILIAVEDLLTYEELERELLKRVARYNDSPHAGLNDRSPRDVFQSSLRTTEPRRPGWDAIWFLPAFTVTTQKHLVVRNTRFASEVNGRRLRIGEKVVYRVDPLLRGLWVEEEGELHFVPTLKDYARGVQVSESVREERRIARQYSDEAQEALEDHLEEDVGAGSVERGKAKARYARKKNKRDTDEPPGPEEPENIPTDQDADEISDAQDHDPDEASGPLKVVNRVDPYGLTRFGNRIRRN